MLEGTWGSGHKVQPLAKDDPLARRLTSIPGVGPNVSLSLIATIDDVARFRKATDVGAYLGLTPRRYQSGETDWSGRISKRGDGAMRKLLYEAGQGRGASGDSLRRGPGAAGDGLCPDQRAMCGKMKADLRAYRSESRVWMAPA